LLSRIVDSKRNIEKIGTNEFSPGLLNQMVKVIENTKLNINAFANFLFTKRVGNKLIASERIR
tara:strand:+ start:782 stop:970 length:189 start_codon:yes stop_codon:yes gene_type:complete